MEQFEILDCSRQYPCWNNLARAANQNVLGIGDHEEPELQEQGQFSEFLKWFTLPIIASTVAITCVPVNSVSQVNLRSRTILVMFGLAISIF